MDSTREFEESSSTTLEWSLRGLKSVFESSKGDSKSKVVKSSRFGNGRWQVLFYPNSGTEGGSFVSLYLSCEPTADEKEKAINGRWSREGLYKFNFEIRNLSRGNLFNTKEACDHTFSHKASYMTANWGWAQFARRDTVFYGSSSARHDDAFVIICTVTSQPRVPTLPPSVPSRQTPKDLLHAVGELLDDPVYSDVVFVLPRTGGPSRERKKIYAAKKILSRFDYFKTMFNSGFSESSDGPIPQVPVHGPLELNSDAGSTQSDLKPEHLFDDSDMEEETSNPDCDAMEEDEPTIFPLSVSNTSPHSSESLDNPNPPNDSIDSASSALGKSSASIFGQDISISGNMAKVEPVSVTERNARPKLTHPSSPRMHESQAVATGDVQLDPSTTMTTSVVPGPQKIQVVVDDVAYATYCAVLYWIYTDIIVFAPLSSTFSTTASSPSAVLGPSSVSQTPMESAGNPVGLRPAQQSEPPVSSNSAATRKEWIAEYEKCHPSLPSPCSPKAVYRLADKLDIQELKDRAFKHIIDSLTVQNVPYEMFSNFSTAFEEIRKVQIKYFLDHWAEIRTADAMTTIWQQIRVGRHPGFEEVWPLIASNLEYRPRSGGSAADSSGVDGRS